MALEMDIAALLSEAELAVREAGLLFNDRELAGHIHHKNKTDYVTEVDTGIQELLRRRLAEILPEAGSWARSRTTPDWTPPALSGSSTPWTGRPILYTG